MSLINTKKYWDQRSLSWDEVPQPLKPTDRDIREFLRFLNRYCAYSNGLGLILGATEKLLKNDLLPYDKLCVDISSKMFNLVKTDVPFMQGDWLDMFMLEDNSVDYIVGDGVLSVLNYNDYDTFFKEMNRVLIAGGIMVLRVFNQANYLSNYEQTENIARFIRLMGSKDQNHNVIANQEFNIVYSFPSITVMSQKYDAYFDLINVTTPSLKSEVTFPIVCFRKK